MVIIVIIRCKHKTRLLRDLLPVTGLKNVTSPGKAIVRDSLVLTRRQRLKSFMISSSETAWAARAPASDRRLP